MSLLKSSEGIFNNFPAVLSAVKRGSKRTKGAEYDMLFYHHSLGTGKYVQLHKSDMYPAQLRLDCSSWKLAKKGGKKLPPLLGGTIHVYL